MPAGLKGERRGAKGARATPARPRPRKPPRSPAVRGPSKLHAAQKSGLPPGWAALSVVLVAALLTAVMLATGDRGQAVATTVRDAAGSRLGSLGLRIDDVRLDGASAPARNAILAAAAIQPGAPILTADLGAIRRRVESVGWVEHARVSRLFPNALVILVDERPLMAVWQHAGRSVVVAKDGTVMGRFDPLRFANLPLIVGEGANLAGRDVLAAVAARPRLAARVQALVRVDQRRWDLRLADGGVIMLPAVDEEGALRRLDALDGQARALDLKLARIDLRDPEMVVVRPKSVAISGEGGA